MNNEDLRDIVMCDEKKVMKENWDRIYNEIKKEYF